MKKIIVYLLTFMLCFQVLPSPSIAISKNNIPLRFNITNNVGDSGTFVDHGDVLYTNFDKGIFENFELFDRLYNEDLYKLDNRNKVRDLDIVREYGFDPFYDLNIATNPASWNNFLENKSYPETFIKGYRMLEYITNLKYVILGIYQYEVLNNPDLHIERFQGHENFLENEIVVNKGYTKYDVGPDFELIAYKDIYYDKHIQSRKNEIKNITLGDFTTYKKEFNRIKSLVPDIRRELDKAEDILRWNLALSPSEATNFYTFPSLKLVNGDNSFGKWAHNQEPVTFNYMNTLNRVYLEEIKEIRNLLDKIEKMELIIYIPSPTNLKILSNTYNKVNLSWLTTKGASGYEIYRATSSSGTYSLVNTATSKSINDVGLTTNQTYYYKIRAFRTIGETKAYSDYSNVVNVRPLLAFPPNLKAKILNSKCIKLTWGSVAGASGYEIYSSTSSSGQYTLIKTTNSISYSNTDLKTGKNYFYKIRAYRLIGKKKVYSNWTKVINVKL